MRGFPNLSFDKRPLVVVFANPNPLSVNLVEKFLASFCRVRVISKNGRGWSLSTHHLNKNKSLEFPSSSVARTEETRYLVFISACFDKKPKEIREKEERKRINTATDIAEKNNAKTLLIFPFDKDKCPKDILDIARGELKKRHGAVGIVYVGEVVGPRMFLDNRDAVTQILKNFISKIPIKLPTDNVYLFPTYIPDLSKALVRNLFSFGSTGEEVVLFSRKITPKDFLNLLKKIKPQISSVLMEQERVERPEVDRQIKLSTDLERAIKETLDWFSWHKFRETKKTKQTKKRKPKKKQYLSRKRAWVALIIFALFVISPFLFLFLGASSFYLGISAAKAGKIKIAGSSMVFSKNISRITQKEAGGFSQIPGAGAVYIPVSQTALILESASKTSLRVLLTVDYAKELVNNVLLDKPFNPSVYSEKLALELDALYKESGFLQSEIGDNKDYLTRNVEKVLGDGRLSELREKILLAKQVVEEIPEILGQDAKKTYLVLFQNNMELRPTGGFIGSFALLTFDKGRLSDISVQDVYSADGQLKGHVEPPGPIKNYLNEANWYLRDSNWDPDFPISATRAEWFLEKEIDRSVDGVVGIDLELVRGLLEEIGPIFLSDFDRRIDDQNLYEVTQLEVEKDFFPGSYKKRNFLTALTRELLRELTEPRPGELLAFSRVFYKSLEEKHMQGFLHNKKAQRAISNLGWDGAVYYPVCATNCFPDWLGMVEANVGVNKANLFLERSANLTVSFENGLVKRNLTVFLKNKANPALGISGRYKTYLRILAPNSVHFQDVEVVSRGSRSTLVPEINETSGRKEAGVLLEIGPGQSKSITFSWESGFNASFGQPGEYRLFWRKQAGTEKDPIVVKFFFPSELNLSSSPPFSLTQGRAVGYNTTLARDFTSRIFW